MPRLLVPLLLVSACTAATVDDTAGPEDTADTADTAATADTADTATEPDGGALYTAVCAGCHDIDGTGTGRGPDITAEVDRLSDAQIVEVILEGEGRMPAQSVTEAEAEAIVAWIRATL